MHQNFQTDHRPAAQAATRGGGDASAGLCALCPGRSRSWSRRSAPGSPRLQTTRSPFVSSYTQAQSLTHGTSRSVSRHCALSPSKYIPLLGRMRLPRPRRESSSNYAKLIPSLRCFLRLLQVNKKDFFF